MSKKVVKKTKAYLTHPEAENIIRFSLILQYQVGPFVFGYPAVGIIGYLIASFFGLGFIVLILSSEKQK